MSIDFPKSEILNNLSGCKCLKEMDVSQLERLAREIRLTIIDTVSKTGGHLAPNLGTVELTVALYSVFDPYEDKIVWDVGHQAYSHKLLTGRRANFNTIRQFGGISGFPKRSESECDAFGVGHAGTSISAAFGMAAARDMLGKNYNVVAVIGDGALTCGEVFEGFNNVGDTKKKVIVILNDNEMSIDKNVGAISEYLSTIRSNPIYIKAKKDVSDIVRHLPGIGERVLKTAEFIGTGVNKAITPGVLFEELGFEYIGPIDGHNISDMQRVFTQASIADGPVLIHVSTIKGKGFLPAEIKPDKFHGVGRFNPINGKDLDEPSTTPTYTEVFADTVIQLADNDPVVCAITAAMPSGTGLNKFMERHPDKFFDVGIAEEHAVTMAAGMATAGLKPFVAIYSTFAQRAYDQILHDVCIQKLPIVLCLDRGGLVGADGPTHHGVFDFSYLRHIPNIVIMAPKDENELRNMLYTAYKSKFPVAVRYPRGCGLGVPIDMPLEELTIGKGAIVVADGSDVAILAIGSMVSAAVDTAAILSDRGVKCTVANMRFAKPIDAELVDKLASESNILVTMEENVLAGGFGSAVLEYINDSHSNNNRYVLRFGIGDEFVQHGSQSELYELCGLLPKQMAEKIHERFLRK